MNINDFELLNRIGSIINGEHGTNDAAIAQYLVEHVRSSQSINVTAIIERAHVTRSAIRRFCNRLGYQSLTDLKASFSRLMFPSDLQHRDPDLCFEDYRAELDVRMLEMYADVESRVSDALVARLAEEIRRREGIEILCANNVSGNLQRFQQEMFFAGKIVRIVSGDAITARRAEPDSLNGTLLIVVSISGMFAASIASAVMPRHAKKVLVTAFCNEATRGAYDEVYPLSSNGNGIDELGVYSKYGVTYFFDLLSSYYLSSSSRADQDALYGPPSIWTEQLN